MHLAIVATLYSVSLGCTLSVIACSAERCAPTVRVHGVFAGSASSCTIDREGGSVLLDGMGRPWNLTRPVSATVEVSAFLRLGTDPTNETFYNAYETDEMQGLQVCPTGSRCCADASGVNRIRTLLRNSSEYHVYSFAWAPVSSIISFPNTTVQNAVWRTFASLPAPANDTSAFPIRIVCSNLDCLFVPAETINNATLGISDAFYQNTEKLCERPVGAITSAFPLLYDGGPSRWDQLAWFRDGHLSPQYPGLFLISLNSTGAVYSSTAISTFFSAELIGAAVQPLFSTLDVSDDGASERGKENVAGVRVTNLGPFDQSVQVALSSCSFDLAAKIEPNRQQDLVLAVNQTMVATFLVTSAAGSSTYPPQCVFEVLSQGIVVSRLASPILLANLLKRTVSARSTACTIDEIPDSCQPVDCTGKYGASKSFFSSQSRVCEAKAVCNNTAPVYVPELNRCSTFLFNPPDWLSYFPVHSNSSLWPAPQSLCNGTLLANAYGEEVCIETIGNATGDNPVAASDSPPLTSKTSTFTWVIVIIALTIASILACCVASCICKARKRKRLRAGEAAYQGSLYRGLQESYLVHQSSAIPTAMQGGSEYQFNLGGRLPANKAAVGQGMLSRLELQALAASHATVYFRVGTVVVPGTLAQKSGCFLAFLTDAGHIFAAEMPLTKLSLEEAQMHISTESDF